MSPELITAIRDRLRNGQTKEEIKIAVLALGHTEVIFEAAYTLALHDAHATVTDAKEPLPRASELFVDGWNFVRGRVDLVLLLLVPGAVSVLLQWMPTSSVSTPLLDKIVFGLDFVTMAAYFFCLVMVMYIVSTEGSTSKEAAFALTAKHVHSFLWISLLSLLLVLGGLTLFIVPGLLVLMLVYFGQYVLVLEDKRGMAALLRSRELVHGRLWEISVVLGKFWILLCIPLFLIGLTVGISASQWSVPDNAYMNLAGNFLVEFFVVIVNIISVHAMFRLFRVLQMRDSVPATASTKVRYWLLALLGFVMTALISGLLFFAYSTDNLYKNLPVISDSTAIENEIRDTALPAREYMLAHNQSYEGVCDTVRPTLTNTSDVTCNDNEESWAISAKAEEGYWCVDTDAVLKKIQTELGERTSCLQLP